MRKVSTHRLLIGVFSAAAALFGLAWVLMETRRLFQGASLHAALDPIGRGEAGTYAVILLIAARAGFWFADLVAARDWSLSPYADRLRALARFGAWGALLLALWVFRYGASPWWGPIQRPLAGHLATAYLFAVYAAGALCALSLAQPAERAMDPLLSRASRLSVVAIVFAAINIVVRWAFRGFDMRPDLREASLETWTFSAVWGLFGFGLLIYGVGRRSNDLRGAGMVVLLATLAKIFLFDMARLSGVVRAGSFLAVGALLLAAAVLVRRLSARATQEPETA